MNVDSTYMVENYSSKLISREKNIGVPHARAQGRAEAVAVAVARQAGVASLLPLKSTLPQEFRSLMVEANRLRQLPSLPLPVSWDSPLLSSPSPVTAITPSVQPLSSQPFPRDSTSPQPSVFPVLFLCTHGVAGEQVPPEPSSA